MYVISYDTFHIVVYETLQMKIFSVMCTHINQRSYGMKGAVKAV